MRDAQLQRWSESCARKAENYSAGVMDARARMLAFGFAMHSYKTAATPQEDYEALRERYVRGEIDLEEFAASVVAILQRGF